MVSNAFAFTANGGKVTLSVGLTQEEATEDIVFEVTDSGLGPRWDEPMMATGRFERSGRQSKSAIGLSLVSSLIEMHGGDVEVSSGSGYGTVVWSRIPLRLPETEDPDAITGLTLAETGDSDPTRERGKPTIDRRSPIHAGGDRAVSPGCRPRRPCSRHGPAFGRPWVG